MENELTESQYEVLRCTETTIESFQRVLSGEDNLRESQHKRELLMQFENLQELKKTLDISIEEYIDNPLRLKFLFKLYEQVNQLLESSSPHLSQYSTPSNEQTNSDDDSSYDETENDENDENDPNNNNNNNKINEEGFEQLIVEKEMKLEEIKEEKIKIEEKIEIKEKIECPICFMESEENKTLSQCEHKYCDECIATYLDGLISVAKVENIPCPDPSCPFPITCDDVLLLYFFFYLFYLNNKFNN